MLVMIQIVIMAQKRILGDVRRYTTIGGRSTRRGRTTVGGSGWVLSSVFLLYALLTTVIPCGFLILRSFCSFMSPLIPISKVLTLANFKLVLGYEAYVQSILNTLIVSSVGGLGAAILRRRQHRRLPFLADIAPDR